MSKVLDLKIEVDFENPLPTMKEIATILKPDWNVDNLKYEDKSTGFVNRNYKVYVPENNDALLVRCTANKSSPVFKTQKVVNRFIHEAKLGPKMYCTLENGVCVEFLEGKTYPWGQTPLLYDSDDLWPQTAEILALYHSKETYEKAKVFGIGQREETVQRGVAKLDQFHANSLSSPSGSTIWAELEWYVRTADKLTPGRRFVHMDPNGTNWLVRDNRQLVLIDYDINCIFYPTADIAWFFLSRCDWTNPGDFADYPDIEYRKKWIRHYLTKLRELDGEGKEVTDEDVDEMEKRVDVGLTYAYLQITIASMHIWLHGTKKQDKQTPWLIWWDAYQKKKAEYTSRGYE